MTTSFTRAFAQALDARRRIYLGVDATLVLLRHKDPRGYEAIITVPDGWNITAGDGNVPLTLEIAESESVTEANIREVVDDDGAFAFNGQVFKISDNDFTTPIGLAKRLWSFKLAPADADPFTG